MRRANRTKLQQPTYLESFSFDHGKMGSRQLSLQVLNFHYVTGLLVPMCNTKIIIYRHGKGTSSHRGQRWGVCKEHEQREGSPGDQNDQLGTPLSSTSS